MIDDSETSLGSDWGVEILLPSLLGDIYWILKILIRRTIRWLRQHNFETTRHFFLWNCPFGFPLDKVLHRFKDIARAELSDMMKKLI